MSCFHARQRENRPTRSPKSDEAGLLKELPGFRRERVRPSTILRQNYLMPPAKLLPPVVGVDDGLEVRELLTIVSGVR